MTVRQLARALRDFNPSAKVTLEGNRLLVGKGFYVEVPVRDGDGKKKEVRDGEGEAGGLAGDGRAGAKAS
jgi:hypothetical protein